MWQQPHDAELDQIWTNFYYDEERYFVRVLNTPDDHERCIQLVLENDKIIRALNMLTDEVSMVSFCNWLRKYLSQNIAYGCYIKREQKKINPLVAVDVLYVRHIRDEYKLPDDSGQAFVQLMKYIKIIERNIRYWRPMMKKVFSYLTSYGIITAPGYEKCQIQKNMLKLRKRVARKICMEFCGSAFIATTGEKKPYRTIKSFNRADLLDCEVNFNTNDIFPIQIMGCRFKHDATE